jgi:hypothetical protein
LRRPLYTIDLGLQPPIIHKGLVALGVSTLLVLSTNGNV